MTDRAQITIKKLDAARRQLWAAMRLWFREEDPVAVHTLAFAAYEIIHVISKKRDPKRRDLIFDALTVRDEFRAEFNMAIKKHASFFKHAKTDWDASIEFAPILSVLFLMGSTAGIRPMRELPSIEETAFVFWFFLHEPRWLTASFRKRFEDLVPIKDHIEMRTVPKPEFLNAFILAMKNSRHAPS